MSQPVRLERVRKTYATAPPVFADLDLEVGAGEVVALLGASGCGKSTLVRLVAGLEQVNGGVVRVGDRRVNGPLRQVGLMFQEPRLLPWLDAAANVAFGLDAAAQRTSGGRRRTLELLAAVGLPEAGDLLPHQLSGGMAQRVAWPGRWPGPRRCCFWTSPSARWTPSPGERFKSCCWRSPRLHGPPCCW